MPHCWGREPRPKGFGCVIAATLDRCDSTETTYAVNNRLSTVFIYLYAKRDSYKQMDGRQKQGKNTDMNQRIELDGVTLEKLPSGDLSVTHHKTNTTAALSASTLVRWLMRHLRALF